jgi:hypothetical protein
MGAVMVRLYVRVGLGLLSVGCLIIIVSRIIGQLLPKADILTFSEQFVSSNVYFIDVDRRVIVDTTPPGRDEMFGAWSPDGSQYAVNHIFPSGGSEAIITDLGDMAERVIERTGYGVWAWSKDSKSLFLRASAGGFFADIVRLDLASGSRDNLTSGYPSIESLNVADYAPDGRNIVYSGNQIYVVESDGSLPRQLTYSNNLPVQILSSSVWSPDGQWIAAIWFVDQYTTRVTLLPFSGSPGHTLPGSENCPIATWAPDSRQLLLVCHDSSQPDIRLYSIRDETFEIIADNVEFVRPIWQDDQIFYVSGDHYISRRNTLTQRVDAIAQIRMSFSDTSGAVFQRRP